MPSKYLTPIISHVSPKEKNDLKKLAIQTNISLSALVRRLVTGKDLPDATRNEDIRDLVKVNGDLARLGNLLKLAIDDGAFEAKQYNKGTDIESLILDIRRSQADLKTKIKILATS